MTNEDVPSKLSSRALLSTTLALVIVALALAVSLVLAIGVASDRGDDLNTLQKELSCRSVVATDFSLVEGEIIAGVAEALVALSRDEPIAVFTEEIDNDVERLRLLAESRAASIEECERG